MVSRVRQSWLQIEALLLSWITMVSSKGQKFWVEKENKQPNKKWADIQTETSPKMIYGWWTNKLIKRFSMLLVAVEMKIKTTIVHFCKTVWQFLYKVNIQLLSDPAIPRYLPKRNESIRPHKDFYRNVHSSFICNSQKLETIRMSIHGWRDKYINVQLYDRIQLNKYGWTIYEPYSMHESQNNCADWKTNKSTYCMIPCI